MKLSKLKVQNYRGLRCVEVPLSSFVCITGENNAGKSSVLQCLSLFLSGSALKKTDYFDEGQEIYIEVTISEVGEADLLLLAEEHRDRIRALLVDDSVTLVRRYGTDGKSQLGYYGMVPKEDRFDPDQVATLVAGKRGAALRDAVLGVFPELAERVTAATTQGVAKDLVEELANGLPADQKELRFKSLPTGVDKSVMPMLPERIYIPAVKDFSDDTKTAETSSFGKILAIVMRVIEPLLAEEADLFDKLSRKLTRVLGGNGELLDERLPEIKRIEDTIQGFVRESFSNVKLEIEIPPPELKTVLSTARILADDGVRGPLELKGDGLRRAVVFSILRSYVELARSADNAGEQVEGRAERGYLLLFEEPELFLHPDAQKILFDALGVFSERNHVVVTTHSPMFLSPKAIATFIRLAKTAEAHVAKPFTRALHVDLTGIKPRDEFQIICFENNSAAFFSKKVVLVEGDSDYIAFPHIMETLDPEWNCRTHSVAFVRVGGKGSIARYRDFFGLFQVPVFVITDLDCLMEGFDKLNPDETANGLREQLILRADEAIAAAGLAPALRARDVTRAQGQTELQRLWDDVRVARAAFEADPEKFAELDAAVDAFFAFEKKNHRRNFIQDAATPELLAAKRTLLWALRKSGVFVLERGALDDYYPTEVTGQDKPTKAQSFISVCDSRDKVVAICPQQTCPDSGRLASEFEFIGEAIFSQPPVH
jgi:putative ATP-dependent endonuclease of OLD family